MSTPTTVRYDWERLDPLVIALYNGIPAPGAVGAFCARHGMSLTTLNKRRRRLTAQGRIRGRSKRPWSAAENAYLDRYYGVLPISTLARSLGRTPAAIGQQVDVLGIRVAAQGYTLAQIAEALGVSATLVGLWRRRGLLHLPGASGNHYYRVRESELHRFFCEDPVNWRRYPCPGREWIEALRTAPDLCRAHGACSQRRSA